MIFDSEIFDSEGVVHPTIGAKSDNYTRNSVQVFEETGTFPSMKGFIFVPSALAVSMTV